jgi:Ca2+-binding EF-hand superfamily protein
MPANSPSFAATGNALHSSASPSLQSRRRQRISAASPSRSSGTRSSIHSSSEICGNSVRSSGLTASPNAATARLDIHQSYQEIFFDKSAEEVSNFSRFNKMALEKSDTADSTELLKRKIRAASYRDGGQNWDALFKQYDRDGSGELDMEEFTHAIRRDAGVTRAVFSDEELARLFERIDADGSGQISAEEFASFIAWRPSAKAAEREITSGMSYAEKLQVRTTGAPFVAEFICVRRAVLREGPEMSSPQVGVLDVGEVVAVVRSSGNRLKCVRLRWGDNPSGWASERSDDGRGETMLEKLPRAEWSSVVKNDTAIATRVASLRSAQEIQRQLKDERERNKEEENVYWSAPLKTFLADGRYREDAKLPEPPPGWKRTKLATPRGMSAAGLISGCESLDDVSMVLDALEAKERDEWPEEVQRQRSEMSFNAEASRIWSEASFTAVDRAMNRRDRVSVLASSEDLASTKAWDGPREVNYAKQSEPSVPPALSGTSRILPSVALDHEADDADASAVGADAGQQALQQVAALLRMAERENVKGKQVDGLRQSMQALERALLSDQ